MRALPDRFRFLSLVLSISLIAALTGCDRATNPTGPELSQSAESPSSPNVTKTSSESEVVPGQYIVVFNDEVSNATKATQRLQKQAPIQEIRHVYRHALKGFAGSIPDEAARGLEQNPRVDYVEQVRTVQAFAQTLPTGVDRIEVDKNGTANIDNAATGVDADIAIIDTGIDLDHPDLNVHRSTDCTAGGPMRNVCNDGDGDDGNGHGTHVAGTAAAIDDGSGVVGVAPGARLWAVKVLGDDGSGWTSDIVAGIDWISGHSGEIEVVNMSLGGSGYSSSMHDAIQNSVSQGVFYAVAAGNDGKDVYGSDGTFGTSDDVSPAAFPEVATISAMVDTDGAPGGSGSRSDYGSDDSFASFSNFSGSVVPDNPVESPGAAIDLLLPGVEIYSTYASGGYNTLSGTSMASPHGAGLAALHIAVNGAPASASEVHDVRQTLIDGGIAQGDPDDGLATKNDPDSNKEVIGWAASGVPSVSWTNPLDGEVVSGSVTLKADASDTDGSVTQVEFLIDGDSHATVTDDSDEWTATWETTQTSSEGDHTLTAEATDDDSKTSSTSITVTVDNQNEGPTASFTYSCTDLTCDFDGSDSYDSDGSISSYDWNFGDGNSGTGETVTHSYGSEGTYTVTLTITDDDGATDSQSQDVNVSASTSSAPTVDDLAISENNSGGSPHAEFDVDWTVSDADGNLDTVELVLSDLNDGETEGTATVDVSGSSASGTTSLKAKHEENSGHEYEVTLTVTDSNGNTETDSATEIENGS